MRIAGIDYSMTSPAICVGEVDNNIKFGYNNKSYALTNSKKSIIDTYSIKVKLHQEFDTDIERYNNISEWVMGIIDYWNIERVFLEGYSFASKSGLICNIAENGGILKYKLFKSNIDVVLVPPTTLKKYATGKGNANKELMEKTFEDTYNINIREILNQTDKQFNPSSDIIDAFFLYRYGIDKLIKG